MITHKNILKALHKTKEHKGWLFFVFSLLVFMPIITASSPSEGGEILPLVNSVTPFIVGILFAVLYVVMLSNKVKPALVTMFGGLLFIVIGFVPFNILLGELSLESVKELGFDNVEGKSAIESIDWNTLALLCGMMILVGILKFTGLFQYIAIKIVKISKGNLLVIWLGFCFATAIMSAFLDNVTTILIIAPITMLLMDRIEISPVPFLISEAICANIGGTATLIGDPPNILIGSAAGLSFVEFIINLGPIALIVLIVTVMVFFLLYKNNFKHSIPTDFDASKVIKNKKLLIIGVVVFLLTLIAFVLSHFFGIEPGPIALFGAIILMIAGRQDPEDWFKEVEWDIIFFFIGLFIMVKGLEIQGILDTIGQLMINVSGGDLLILSMMLIWVVGIASSFLGAVPIVTTLIPIMFFVQNSLSAKTGSPVNIDTLWWSMSLGACLGGNGTIFGTATNMVTVSLTSKRDDKVTFMEFFKVGYPMMLLSLLLSSLYIFIRYFIL